MIARFPKTISFPRSLWSVIFLMLANATIPDHADAEAWTDLRGTRTIDARMMGIWGDNVLLELTNGRRVSVNLNSLRSDSRIQARHLSKKLAEQRATRVGELEQASIAAAAAAPDPLPQPDASPDYQAPKNDVAVDAFLNQIDRAIEAGHVRAVYDALPPSYRADVDEIVRLAVAKVDQEGFRTIVRCLHQSGSVLVTHQNWLLSSPRIQALPESTNDLIRVPVLSLAGLAHATKDSDLFSLEKLASQPFGQWLNEFDKASCDYLHQAHQTSGKSILRSIDVVSTRDDVTRVKIQSDNQEFSSAFTKVDGFWVPTSMDQEKWTTMVANWKKQIEQNDGAALVEPYADHASKLIVILEALSMAGNSNDFHAAMETSAEFLTSSLPQWFGIKLDFGSDDRRGY